MSGPDKRYFNLLREFTLSWFKLRDQGTVLGFLWTLLHPLLLLLVLYLLFKKHLGGGIPHFGVYLLIGIIHWSFFATATTKTVQSLTQRGPLVGNVYFPRELLVFSDVGSVLISFVLEILVLLGFVVVEGIPLRAAWLFLPVVAALQAILILGVGLGLAGLHVFVRDVERIWTIVLRIGFFLVPIFYSTSLLENPTQRLVFELNPLTQLMTFSRTVLIHGRLPSPGWVAYTLVVGGLLFSVALAFFRRAETSFAERL